jgi:cobalt-zinc-cadmium resistance protein CzcA
MLSKIIDFSVKNKLIVGLFILALLGYGIFQFTKLPIDAVPDITNNQVQVITVAPSYGATDIERLVTFPIEQANSNIDGIEEIRSFSRFGLSLVTIVFEDDIDIYWARQQVFERLQAVKSQIPSDIGEPELGPISSGLGEIFQYVIKPKPGYESKYDAIELRSIQDWIVRRQLLGVKGVAEVSSFGGKLKQYSIEVSSEKLHAFGITIQDVFSALERNNQNTGGAYIEKGPTVLFIRSEGLINAKEDIENVPIKSNQSGLPLLIRDVANVKIGFATRYGAMCYNDEGEVAGAIVMMLKGANSNEVIKNVKARVAQIEKTLPEGVMIEPFLDRTKMVNNAIGTVETNLLEGALIVIFVLVLFLGNFRAGLLVASVIPLSMLFAVIMMNIFGVSGNLMSLGALDFGLIVDGAVIIVEAVMHRLASSKQFEGIRTISQSDMDKAVKQSAGKMMNSAVFGQVIILIVYLPIFSLEGIEGKMFKPMAQTVAFALLGAFLLSLTYIPMMSSLFLSKKVKPEKNFSDILMGKIENGFQILLNRTLQFPKLVLSMVAGLFIVSIVVLTQLGGEFIPALEEGDFAVDTRVLTGSNLNTTITSTQQAAHVLLTRFPEVEKVVTKIGSGEVPTDPMPMEASDMMVVMKDKKTWKNAKTFDEMAEKMSEALFDIPGITFGFQYPVQMRFNELMTGARQDVVCKLFGENLDTLSLYANKLGALVNTVNGVQNLYVEPISGMPQILIQYNRPVLAQYNMSIEDINRMVNTAFAGQSAGKIFEGERRFDLVVRLNSAARSSLEDVQQLLIPTPSGIQLPLHHFAKVSIEDGPNQIQREDAKRRIVVGFNVRGRDVQSVVEEVQQKVEQKIKFPTGYYTTYGGSFENLTEAKKRLFIAVPVSLCLIYLLLFFAFNSMKQAMLIYTAIPLSAIGGIFFLAMRGLPFSISAGVGFIALFGVAVLNGIVLIAEFNRLKSEGEHDLGHIVRIGTRLRLRPVLMTAFVASLGFLPMALSHGAGAEVQRPLATVVIGGLLIATFLTLFVLPILYLIFEKGIQLHTKKAIGMIIFMGLICSSQFGWAQRSISFEEAFEIALQQNLELKNESLKTAYLEKLRHTQQRMGNTDFVSETGQVNSMYYDTKVGVVQNFKLPSVYKNQKSVLDEEFNKGALNEAVQRKEIKRQLGEVFIAYFYTQQGLDMLKTHDTMYQEFLRKASLRFEKGESNLLEKAMAEHQLGQIHLQVEGLESELELYRLRLKYILNSTEDFQPSLSNSDWLRIVEDDTDSAGAQPRLKLLAQEVKINQAKTKLEKASFLPDFTVGYLFQTMRNTPIAFSGNYLSYAQLGVSMPLSKRPLRKRLEAIDIQNQVTNQQIEWTKKQINTELNEAKIRYQRFKSMVDYYEEKALNNSNQMSQLANLQYTQGEINYLEWVMLMNQSMQIQSEYREARYNLNKSILQYNYLKSTD